MKPHIHLVVMRPDGRRSDLKISGDHVTLDMFAVAEDLLETLTTGTRPPLKGLYELCAKAFGTTQKDAKERLLGAAYGKDAPANNPRTATKGTDGSWPPMHNLPSTKK